MDNYCIWVKGVLRIHKPNQTISSYENSRVSSQIKGLNSQITTERKNPSKIPSGKESKNKNSSINTLKSSYSDRLKDPQARNQQAKDQHDNEYTEKKKKSKTQNNLTGKDSEFEEKEPNSTFYVKLNMMDGRELPEEKTIENKNRIYKKKDQDDYIDSEKTQEKKEFRTSSSTKRERTEKITIKPHKPVINPDYEEKMRKKQERR